MVSFPTDFTDKTEPLTKSLGQPTDEAMDFLAGRGFVVLTGLDEALAKSISQLALQPHIRKYCPKDCTDERFANRQSTQRWLSRGHAFFVLAKKQKSGFKPVGYGWSGPKKTNEVPQGETTFAVRLGQEGLGQGLAAPFSQIIVASTANKYGAKKIWLETWASNAAAVHVYKKLGFELVNQKPAKRSGADGSAVDDSRLYMLLPDELLLY